MRRRLGVAPLGALVLVALAACGGGSSDRAASRDGDSQPTAQVSIEARAAAALVADTLANQGQPVDVSVEEMDSSLEVYVSWRQDAPVTLVRVLLSEGDRALGRACDSVTKPCEAGTAEAGDFVVLRSSKTTVEGFRQAGDGDSLAMTAYGAGDTFEVVRSLIGNGDLSWTVAESVNQDNQWKGRLSPVRVTGSAEKVRR